MRSKKLLGLGMMLSLAVAGEYAITAPRVGANQAPALAQLQAASPSQTVEFSVYLPLRHEAQLDALLSQLHDPKSAKYQQWLTPADFLQRFGPTEADLAKVRAALAARGFTVVSSNAHGVRVRGQVSSVTNTFGVAVHTRAQPNGRARFMAKSALQIPSELAALNVRVMGLEALPQRQSHARASGPLKVENRYGVTGPYWFTDLKQAYDYPAYGTSTDGTGVSVAVLMTDLLFPGDLAAAFGHEQFTAITGKPAPSVTTVTVDGGGVVDGPGSFEASLDVQQVLGGAPATKVTLVSIPDLSDQSVIDGYTYIVDTNTFDIVNSSFGGCELEYTAAYNGGVDYTYILKQEHEIYAQGNAEGITFVASSGDEGGLICPGPEYAPGVNSTFGPGVSSPASDPDVTAVGGGNLITVAATPPSLNSAYVRESAFADPDIPYDIYGLGALVSGGVWGAGGGVSSVFGKPLYQYLVKSGSNSGRTVPDVGMQVGGCPQDLAASCGADDSAAVVAYGVGVGGGYYGVIGTSVSSPEFVGALAIYEQQFGRHHRLGNVNYFLYAAGAIQTLIGGVNAPPAFQFFRRNIPGFDGYWNASYPSYNYNYIYGNGSPDVRKLLGLSFRPAAGQPQTPTNP
jgi:subtilase family serine protease